MPLSMQSSEPETALLEAVQVLCHCAKGKQAFSGKSQHRQANLHHTEYYVSGWLADSDNQSVKCFAALRSVLFRC